VRELHLWLSAKNLYHGWISMMSSNEISWKLSSKIKSWLVDWLRSCFIILCNKNITNSLLSSRCKTKNKVACSITNYTITTKKELTCSFWKHSKLAWNVALLLDSLLYVNPALPFIPITCFIEPYFSKSYFNFQVLILWHLGL